VPATGMRHVEALMELLLQNNKVGGCATWGVSRVLGAGLEVQVEVGGP